MVVSKVSVYDCILRDGTQQEGISVSVNDKLAIASQLDLLGIAYIEGGYPGSNPKDIEFFERAKTELNLKNARLSAFGSTCHKGKQACEDAGLTAIVNSGVSTCAIFGKASATHVEYTLHASLEENLRMVEDSISFLKKEGLEVFFDAEHFFDGYAENPEYSMSVLDAAARGGADAVVLCETNGGRLPFEVYETTRAVVEHFEDRQIMVGIHAHNDGSCGVANTLEAVRAGAVHVQGCVNGYGERVGNADLDAIIAALELKCSVHAIGPEKLKKLTPVAHTISQILNKPIGAQHPYIGAAAFAHKGGMHASAIARMPGAYNHIDPASVGNVSHMVVSELAGKASMISKTSELGFNLAGNDFVATSVLEKVKEKEAQGFAYELADASLALIVAGRLGIYVPHFKLESFRIISEMRDDGRMMTEATIKVFVGEERFIATAEGNGPVNAIDRALRIAITRYYPQINNYELTDYKVRVLDENVGTDAVTRVIIETTDGTQTWGSVGVSENVIEASWEALVDSIEFGLTRATIMQSNPNVAR